MENSPKVILQKKPVSSNAGDQNMEVDIQENDN